MVSAPPTLLISYFYVFISLEHSMHPSLSAEQGWAFNQIFKKGGLTGPQLLEGGCWERGSDFFQDEGGRGGGGCNCHIKNKLKSEIFNDEKSLWANIFFSFITRNSNWDILLKNLVTFKR